MAVECKFSIGLTTTETITIDDLPAAAGDASVAIKHSGFNFAATLNATSTPPVTKCAFFNQALSGGAATIDLTALPGPNNTTVDLTGLKVQLIHVHNKGANAMTIVPGASNGIDLLGASSSVTIPAGGRMTFFANDGSPDVAAGDRTLDISGTAAQTCDICVEAG